MNILDPDTVNIASQVQGHDVPFGRHVGLTVQQEAELIRNMDVVQAVPCLAEDRLSDNEQGAVRRSLNFFRLGRLDRESSQWSYDLP
ncbi:hypothetical protein [Frankia sp. CiP1_Cm_nod1]|uniref:hypothetical protein n=1 Tax=Frankia sp. CiP1_Cm_nod1 TaxID=2897160 RepID=UPI0020244A24